MSKHLIIPGNLQIYNYITKIENLDLSLMSSYQSMFYSCRSLESVTLTNSNPNVTSTEQMFSNNTALTDPPLFDTSNVQYMTSMFNGCGNLVNVPLYNTQSCVNFSNMFYYCTKIENAPSFNTHSATNLNTMFGRCSSLMHVPVYDTVNVLTMNNMFQNCTNLTGTSLNNIMQMCIDATSYTGTKTLRAIGITSALVNQCMLLPNWSLLTAAGWTGGY